MQIESEAEFEERVQFIPMTEALVKYTASEDKFTRETAMDWLSKFVSLGRNKLIVVLDQLIRAVLACLSASAVRPIADDGCSPCDALAVTGHWTVHACGVPLTNAG